MHGRRWEEVGACLDTRVRGVPPAHLRFANLDKGPQVGEVLPLDVWYGMQHALHMAMVVKA